MQFTTINGERHENHHYHSTERSLLWLLSVSVLLGVLLSLVTPGIAALAANPNRAVHHRVQ